MKPTYLDLVTVQQKDFKVGIICQVNFGDIRGMIGHHQKNRRSIKTGNANVFQNRLNKLQIWLLTGKKLRIKSTYTR